MASAIEGLRVYVGWNCLVPCLSTVDASACFYQPRHILVGAICQKEAKRRRTTHSRWLWSFIYDTQTMNHSVTECSQGGFTPGCHHVWPTCVRITQWYTYKSILGPNWARSNMIVWHSSRQRDNAHHSVTRWAIWCQDLSSPYEPLSISCHYFLLRHYLIHRARYATVQCDRNALQETHEGTRSFESKDVRPVTGC